MGKKISFRWETAYLVLSILGALLIVRSFFGVDLTDESFYFSLAKRFSQGDRLLCDEWFPSQLIGALLLPFYDFYIAIHGNQEGIILCARISYVLFSIFVAAYMIWVFKKSGKSCGYSFLAAVMFCIYVRASIGTFSYYSLGLESFLLSILLCMDAKISGKAYWKWVLGGISFSVSVICMPYVAVLFVAVVYWAKSKRLYKEMLCFCGGVFCAAGVFLGIFGAHFMEGVKNIPEILMDPQHQGGLYEKVSGVIKYLCFTYLHFLWPVYLTTLIAGMAICVKKRDNLVLIKGYQWIIYLEFFIQALYSRTFFEGGIVFAVFLLAVQLQIINPEIRQIELEKYFLFPGLAFGFMWILGSNVGMRVLNMGFLLADVWALKVIMEAHRGKRDIFRVFSKASLICLFSVLFLNRFMDVYRDNVIWKLNTPVTIGSMKGIYTTAERAKEYELVVSELRKYTNSEDRFATPGLNPWLYLETPAKCGAYSTWQVDFTDERNWSYYKKYEENTPNIIFLLEPSFGKYFGWRFGSHGSNIHGSGVESIEGYLEELVNGREYREEKRSSGIYYILEE